MSTVDWVTPWHNSFLGNIKNLLMEVAFHVSRNFQNGKQPRLVMFPCGDWRKNPSSLLRTHLIGEALKNQFGWRVSIVPPRFSLAQRLRILRLEQPNLILMQMERHPLNRPKFYKPFPVVFDIDDADFLWEHAYELVVECCRDSVAVIAGSRFVADWAANYNDKVNVIWTGSPPRLNGPPPSQLGRGNIVAWGHSQPHNYPHEADFVEKVLIGVARQTPVEYWIFGIENRKQLDNLTSQVSTAGVTVRAFVPMPFDVFTRHLEKVAVGLQVLSPENSFSQGKSFGKILNYITAGAVVVASNGADHEKLIKNGINGFLADDINSWTEIIVRLLNNPVHREETSREAYKDFLENLSVNAIATQYNRQFHKLTAIPDAL